MGNVGPGFGEVGSMDNFSAMPAAFKVSNSLLMLLGRLEIFGLIQIFSLNGGGDPNYVSQDSHIRAGCGFPDRRRSAAQQPEVEARIAGLEGNAEYMSLLREDAQLQIREDSIVNAVERMRRQLREDPGKRQQYSQEILQLESRIFEIRNAKGRLIDRINTIEQEWVLASLNGAAQQPAASAEKALRRRSPTR